jgi:glutathione S-transferase
MTTDTRIVLHGFKPSGHSHRAELMLSLLKLPYEFRSVDLRRLEQKTPEFLALNVFGTVPVLDDGGVVVADSVAILVYLSMRYDSERRWFPADPVEAARVQRWLSVAQGPVFNGPATARIIKLFGGPGDHPRAITIAEKLLAVLEVELVLHPYLAGLHPTLADVAVYSYVARAPEGGVSLDAFAAVQAWLKRVEELPGFLPMAAMVAG